MSPDERHSIRALRYELADDSATDLRKMNWFVTVTGLEVCISRSVLIGE